jgi:hypothetical protein
MGTCQWHSMEDGHGMRGLMRMHVVAGMLAVLEPDCAACMWIG